MLNHLSVTVLKTASGADVLHVNKPKCCYIVPYLENGGNRRFVSTAMKFRKGSFFELPCKSAVHLMSLPFLNDIFDKATVKP